MAPRWPRYGGFAGVAGACLIALVSSAGVARAAPATWFVTPTGSDGNSCSDAAHPCATVNGAISKAAVGDTVEVASGTYTGSGDQVVLVDKGLTLEGGWNSSFSSQAGVSTVMDKACDEG